MQILKILIFLSLIDKTLESVYHHYTIELTL